ncbi:hypothetical protein AAGF08_04055 [Algoriphagus sp. SE2]|uniref:hypothetical protein n=1 Tax=Algoriphagus sp. SE2 TaxID=3141536 RepID=UPI0031CD04EF
MKKRRVISLFHQFYKELKIAKVKGKSALIPIKHLPDYIQQNRIKKDFISEGIPWMTVPAVKFLKKYITKNSKGFEYGSGASTLFFANKGVDLVSIDHNSEWFEKIKNVLDLYHISNVNYFLVEPDGNSEVEGVFSKKEKKYINKDFSVYAKFIQSYPDRYFDFIVIDGRVRLECLKYSLSKLKKGGILIFDNADREEYKMELLKIKSHLKLSEYTVTANHLYFSQTNIYQF